MNVADVLERAADLIDHRGHFKGRYCEGPRGCGSLCVLGAIRLAHDGKLHNIFGDFSLASIALTRFLRVVDATAVSVWNDYHTRTASEVTSTLRACAAVERARAAVAEAIPIKVSA